MTQYEIIQMANEAGLNSYRIAPAEAVAVWERFAALVEAKAAAKEREACAQVCEQARSLIWEYAPTDVQQTGHNVCSNLAKAIRARGNK